MSGHYFHLQVDCDTNTFELHGELDLSSSGALRETLAAARASVITVDLAHLSFIDSAGLACLAAAAQDHESVVLRNARPCHRRLLDIVNLRSQFVIEDAPLEVRSPLGSRNACAGRRTTQPGVGPPGSRPMTSVLSVGFSPPA